MRPRGDLFDAPPVAAKPQRPAGARFEGAALLHVCAVCGSPLAPWGFDVFLRSGRLGTWYCGEHRPGKAGA